MSTAVMLSRRTYIVAPVNGGATSSNVILPLTSGTVFIPFHILRLQTPNEIQDRRPRPRAHGCKPNELTTLKLRIGAGRGSRSVQSGLSEILQMNPKLASMFASF